jgi:hypothetical protein
MRKMIPLGVRREERGDSLRRSLRLRTAALKERHAPRRDLRIGPAGLEVGGWAYQMRNLKCGLRSENLFKTICMGPLPTPNFASRLRRVNLPWGNK